MQLIDTDKVSAATETAIEKVSEHKHHNPIYAQSMKDGDNSTVSYAVITGDPKIIVKWYVMLNDMDPDTQIIPDDTARCDTTNTPVHDDWKHLSHNQGHEPTPASELGDRVQRADDALRTTIANTPHVVNKPEETYVARVGTQVDGKLYCQLLTVFTIEEDAM